MEETIGTILEFAGNFAPKCFMNCDGRSLPVSNEYLALFAIIGTTYGGDGVKTFCLPDLRPFANDGQPDTGHHRKVDWSEVGMPRKIICVNGIFPARD